MYTLSFAYKKVFFHFDVKKVAGIDESYTEKLMLNKGIIRNRLKIKSVGNNAKVYLKIQNEYGSFNTFIWNYVNNKPINGTYSKPSLIPTKNELSDRISKDLKKKGMSFVGTRIIYAFMQAIGMINAHTTDCFRYQEIITDYSGGERTCRR